MLTYRANHPRETSSVPKARRALFSFASACGFRDTSLSDVESAAGEALANAAEHGGREAPDGYDVSATFDGVRLVIDVEDHGRGFDGAAALNEAPPSVSGNRGFGIFLMHALMDEVAYSDRGSRIHLVKRLTFSR